MTTQQYSNPYPAPAEPAKGKGLGIAALILGIVGFLLSFTCILSWLGALLGVVGIILGAVGMKAASKSPGGKKGLFIAGIIASAAALLIGLILTIVGFLYAVEFAQWGITEGANAEADVWAADARSRGVDEETIQAARARLDAALDNGPSDFQDMQRYTQDVERAKQNFRDALEGDESGETQADPVNDGGTDQGDVGGGP